LGRSWDSEGLCDCALDMAGFANKFNSGKASVRAWSWRERCADAQNLSSRFAPCRRDRKWAGSRGNASTDSVMRVLTAKVRTGVIKKKWWISTKSSECG